MSGGTEVIKRLMVFSCILLIAGCNNETNEKGASKIVDSNVDSSKQNNDKATTTKSTKNDLPTTEDKNSKDKSENNRESAKDINQPYNENNAAEYVLVSFSGENGKGIAVTDPNIEKFIQIKHNYTLVRGNDAPEFIKRTVDNFINGLQINLDKSSNLSNGDIVTLSVNVDPNRLYSIHNGQKQIVVTGLE